jgi:hypothetical protein
LRPTRNNRIRQWIWCGSAPGSQPGLLDQAAAIPARALDIAQQNHDRAAEMLALYAQSAAAGYGGDVQMDLSCMRQADDIDPAAVPGQIARRCIYGLTAALYEASELDPHCATVTAG